MSPPAPRSMLCDRTREWAALRLDGELSEFERAIMSSHLDRCEACRTFAADVEAIARALRSAPLEPLPRPIEIRPLRRLRVPLRHVQVAAAAALVAAAVGLGSVYGALHGDRSQRRGGVVQAPIGFVDDEALLREVRLAQLRPTAPLPLGATKPPLEVSI